MTLNFFEFVLNILFSYIISKLHDENQLPGALKVFGKFVCGGWWGV